MYPVRGSKRSTPIEAAGIRFLLDGTGWRTFQPSGKSLDRRQRYIKCSLCNVLGVVGSRLVADAVRTTKSAIIYFRILS